MILRTEPATERVARLIAPRLRAADRAEALLSGSDVEEMAARSVLHSDEAEVLFGDGVPIAIYGVGPWEGEVGCAWLLGTPHVTRMGARFALFMRRMLPRGFARYEVLANVGLASNLPSLRLLKILGFTLNPPTRLAGMDVVSFYKRRETPCAN